MATPGEDSLIISTAVYDAMIAHCVGSPDRACCGILAGTPPRVSAIYPLRNTAANPRRYDADPRDLVAATLDLRDRGLSIAAIYHSCPEDLPIPSETDIAENHYGDIPRVILSVGEVIEVCVWRLTGRNCEELNWRLLPREEDAGS